MDEDVEVVATAAGVLADQTFFVGFLDCTLQDGGFVVEFTADVDIGGSAIHRSAGNEAAFNQFVRVFAHDFSIFAGAGLAFVGINNEVAGFGVFVPAFEVHK